MSKTLPGNVETSLEWPVSRRRIEALLAVRAGNNRRARRLFEDAIRWTQKEGYTLEHAIAQAQLAELLALTDICLREQVWTDLRTESWATLKTLDVNPLPHCYAVARCISSLKAERHKPELSPREAQVLKALAEGLSYRQTAERLGVHWQTVQTVAHRIYDKLDARGKFRAITIARELGIL
jgi:ATP/maltotriose-dependent transcriptional regulator MalT